MGKYLFKIADEEIGRCAFVRVVSDKITHDDESAKRLTKSLMGKAYRNYKAARRAQGEAAEKGHYSTFYSGAGIGWLTIEYTAE